MTHITIAIPDSTLECNCNTFNHGSGSQSVSACIKSQQTEQQTHTRINSARKAAGIIFDFLSCFSVCEGISQIRKKRLNGF